MLKIFAKSIAVAAVCACVFLLSLSAYAEEKTPLLMATTTSTDNTGLLDYLAPLLKEDAGIELRWTAVGTGKALKMAENCDVDVLLVHAPPSEKAFIEAGFGIKRHEVMSNDFVMIGPAADPAGLKRESIRDAFEILTAKEAIFVSRGDNSGTHKKELMLWNHAGLPVLDKKQWYIQTGQGMLTTIRVAAERNGYCLTDRGTYIKYEKNMKGDPPLEILVEGDDILLNQYSVIVVNPEYCPNVQYDSAVRFVKWITGPNAQQHIGSFKLLGKSLFTPNAKAE